MVIMIIESDELYLKNKLYRLQFAVTAFLVKIIIKMNTKLNKKLQGCITEFEKTIHM